MYQVVGQYQASMSTDQTTFPVFRMPQAVEIRYWQILSVVEIAVNALCMESPEICELDLWCHL